MNAKTAREPAPALRRARLATATLFFANGCGLDSWVPHNPEVKIWHSLSEGALGLALLVIAAGAGKRCALLHKKEHRNHKKSAFQP